MRPVILLCLALAACSTEDRSYHAPVRAVTPDLVDSARHVVCYTYAQGISCLKDVP